MAQYTAPEDPQKDGSKKDSPTPSGFHYYAGGEVKELENTPVSPLLWGLWSVVILGAIGYLIFGGALGPHLGGGFKPTSGSTASLAAIQTDVNKNAQGNAEGARAADMSQLKPFVGHESLATAVSNGSNIYQSYCIGCHGPNQDGNGVNASSLNPKPRNLHDGPFMRETLDYHRINHSLHYGVHGTAMPRWENTLSEQQIQEVIAYALSLTWTMPPSSKTDTTTAQLASFNKSPGGSTVHGGSVSNSPAPITPIINGNPENSSTAPPSQSGQPAGVDPKSLKTNAPSGNAMPGGGM